MNSLHLLFTTRYQEIKRQLKIATESRFRTYTVAICALLFWSGLFAFFLRGFSFFTSYIPQSFSNIIIDYMFSIFYFALFTMLMFSSLLIAISLFFKNNETKFLMTKPIPHQDIFLYKLSETFVFASWAVFFLGVPVAWAYGIQQGVNLWFYPLVIVSFIPYIIIPCTLGALLSFIIILYIAKFKKALGIIFALVLSVGIAYLIYSIAAEKENAPSYSAVWLFNVLAYFQFTKWPFSPSLWMSQCMQSVALLEWGEFFFHFMLLLSTSLALVLFSYYFAASNYFIAWSRVYSDLSSKKLWKLSLIRKMLTPLIFVSRRAKLFLEKDLKIFIRDPVQWSQFAILLGLLLLYILNLRTLKYDQKSTFWREIIANLNLMAISLTACTFASRFIFPMLSLEGKRFWTLGVMPIKRSSIIMAKFIFAMVILTLMTQILVLLSAIMLKFPWSLMVYHSIIALLLTSGIAGLAVGLGAIYPNFREDSPSKIVSGFGGTLNLVVSLVYVFVVIFTQIIPSHILLTSTLSKSFYILTFAAISISATITLLPLWIGINKFNKIEI
ncbi:hypothetical protein [Candidatus Uabimicrobium sp. HlEnr_7]|uniref:putative ABC transporter permease subunit n=1 Tax=Candidatus Uabimicrobium helgolandensis TaxID=3095367 RepID=UPI0035566ED1